MNYAAYNESLYNESLNLLSNNISHNAVTRMNLNPLCNEDVNRELSEECVLNTMTTVTIKEVNETKP